MENRNRDHDEDKTRGVNSRYAQNGKPLLAVTGGSPKPSSIIVGNDVRPETHNDPEDEPEDEYCVYTYKGDSRPSADLPSSFYRFESSDGSSRLREASSSYNGSLLRIDGRLTNGASSSSNSRNHNGVNGGGENVFSPDMDFLEMDFDPGGPGDDSDSNHGVEPCYEEEMKLLDQERNLFSKQLKVKTGAVNCESYRNFNFGTELNPLQNSRNTNSESFAAPAPTSAVCPAMDFLNPTRNTSLVEITETGLDITDGNKSSPSKKILNPVNPVSPSETQRKTSFVNNPSDFESSRNSQACSGAPNSPEVGGLSNNESPEQPKPHCSKTLSRERGGNIGTSGGIIPPAPAESLGICNNCNNKFAKTTKLKGNWSPTNQFSLRLVKSNTLPEMGRHLKRDSDDADSPSTSSAFLPVRSSGISFSAPVIKDEPHFRAIINTNTSSSSSSNCPEDFSVELEVGSVMLWTIEDAYERSVNQIGVSACGATAVCNTLSALGYDDVQPRVVNNCVATRLRAELADLPEYLFSRSNAGATHVDLINGIVEVSEGNVNGRFFQPKPNISPDTFSKWLLHWICKGAVPVVTRNMQIRNPIEISSSEIPDAWHHQMVFGVSPGILFLSNPIESVNVKTLLPQLTSSSVLLVRRSDIICRRTPKTDLRLLARHPDIRWNEMNVLGQVANIIREDTSAGSQESKRDCLTHIQIPADYKGGVTLFMHLSNSSYPLLINAPDL